MFDSINIDATEIFRVETTHVRIIVDLIYIIVADADIYRYFIIRSIFSIESPLFRSTAHKVHYGQASPNPFSLVAFNAKRQNSCQLPGPLRILPEDLI